MKPHATPPRLLPVLLAILISAACAWPGRAAIIAYVGGGTDLWDGMIFTTYYADLAVVAANGVGMHRDISEEPVQTIDFYRDTDNPQDPYYPAYVHMTLNRGGETGSNNWGYFRSDLNGYHGWAQFDWNAGAETITLISYAFDNTGAALSLPDAVGAVNGIPEPASWALGAAALLITLGRRRLRPCRD